MPRKKKSESSSEVTIDDTTSQEVVHGQSSPEDPFPSDPIQNATQEAGVEAAPAGDQPPFRPVRHTFTSKRAGIHAGEDKRFNAPQTFVDFADEQRATDAEKVDLREAGFRYRPSDKGYSALANAETRQSRDEMAQKFTERRLKEKAEAGEGQGTVNYTEFVRRFPEDKEIGRDITDDELVVFSDNGTDVGVWREDRRSTIGRGEVLSPKNAEMARYWYRNPSARSR